jgi:hypothetical protein
MSTPKKDSYDAVVILENLQPSRDIGGVFFPCLLV